MIVLSCSGVSKAYIADNIIEDITFAINNGEKVGLVGPNGAGKTTLFKILTNQLSKDSGDIFIPKGMNIGYLEQNTKIESDFTVYEEVKTVFNHLIEMESEIRDLEHQIAELGTSGDHDEMDKVMNRYSRLSEEFNAKNGYAMESEIRGVLKGLGFDDSQFEQSINTLSGGQKTRVILAKLLLNKPDIILLDEPTNHLDLEAISWLEKYIKDYKGAVVIISHDRYFLDATVSKIFHLENTKLKIYTGNYTTYVKKRAIERELELKRYESQQKEIERQKEIITRFMGYGGKRYVRQAQSRQKMLDKMEKMNAPESDKKRASIRFEPKIKSGNDVMMFENLSKSFDDLKLFEDLNLNIYRGERVGLIGPNGIGKTTLFKMIKQAQNNDNIKLGTNVHIGYFDQEQSNLNDEKTIVDEIWDENPAFDHFKIRSMLARFLFTGDDIFKIIGDLSGGEKSRLSLLKLMLSKSNFLLMDEPTNHLDIASKEVLEDALLSYDGTIFVISHDRYFLNKVINKIVDMNTEGLTEYLGNYNYYIEKKSMLEYEEEEVETQTITKTQMKLDRKKQKEIQKEEKKRKKRINEIEESIFEHESRIEEIEELMCLEEIYSDIDKSRELHDEMNNLKEELENLYLEWEELHE